MDDSEGVHRGMFSSESVLHAVISYHMAKASYLALQPHFKESATNRFLIVHKLILIFMTVFVYSYNSKFWGRS